MNAVAAPAWPAWSDVTTVVTGRAAANAPVLVRVRLPPLGIAPDSGGGYPDLRVIDDRGAEIPFALDPPPPPPSDVRELPLIDTGFVPGRGSQAVVDRGANAPLADSVTVGVDTGANPTFFERLGIDASDDRATWRIVRTGALIYRVEDDRGNGNQAIAFPATRSRWLRIRVLDAHAPFPLTGATVGHSQAGADAPLVPLALVPSAASEGATRRQTWTFSAPRPFRATAVAFAGASGTFSRAVSVETSDDGVAWSDAGNDSISRFADGNERTSFAFDERTARFVRVTIDNGGDQPLDGLRVSLLSRPHAVVFRTAPHRRYALISGNANAAEPSYDFGERLAHASWRAMPAYTSATTPNRAYRDQRPIGERLPWLVTAASIGLAIVLGAAAIATIRRKGVAGDSGGGEDVA